MFKIKKKKFIPCLKRILDAFQFKRSKESDFKIFLRLSFKQLYSVILRINFKLMFKRLYFQPALHTGVLKAPRKETKNFVMVSNITQVIIFILVKKFIATKIWILKIHVLQSRLELIKTKKWHQLIQSVARQPARLLRSYPFVHHHVKVNCPLF